MKVAMLGLLAETPIHSGTGRSMGVVDLPVAREAATDYPVLVGSSLKGALRDKAEGTTSVGGADLHAPNATTGGGGGGGVIAILSDDTIVVSGTVTARGADVVYSDFFPVASGGGGAGGSIFLRALRGVTIAGGAKVLATGGVIRNSYWNATYRSGADGFVRVDAYGGPPRIDGDVAPKPEAYEIPELRELNPPRIGWVWRLRTASVPGDVLAGFLGRKGARIPLPPFGILRLDPSAPLIFVGGAVVHGIGHDPWGEFLLPVHQDPILVGVELHMQAINLLTDTRRPRLTNAVVTTIQK